MISKISDFIAEWNNEAASTERVLDALTDESLGQTISQDSRTLGQTGWHLVWSMNFMAQLGLTVAVPDGEQRAPASASKIASEYRRVRKSLLDAIESQWTDETLAQSQFLYGMDWPNWASLRYMIQHEVHHRGQMTVLMRLAGLRVPGILGPTREEWIEQGKEPLI